MTGASNRRHFTARLAAELTKRRPLAEPLCLLSLDLDHFKEINDRYGHAAGDAVLKAVTRACCETVRAGDIVARVGGEEFMVLLAGAAPAVACGVAERIRASVEALRVPINGGTTIQVTVSVGLARADQDGVSSDHLLRAAAQRLYEAKRLGRNRVAFA
ncbi:PAS/PAC sensor-containing diguanylate cyclase [Pandoraea terrae]|uniref:diguanylate cyclase n=1 Tax=Pandoraea terrae TaxID=1537710 RepID=A0A5E4UEN0_9BURK|nr:GGDEF domain-containing protein [Pandoraea terrae]VVD97314.1 PAS/PAC sensor-containing diguanylate cyclase [Pandoraea terrae]